MNRTQDWFEAQFDNYDEIKGNAWGLNWRAFMIFRTENILHTLNKLIYSIDKPEVLEIGCATGDFTVRYIDNVKRAMGEICGVDISEKAVRICKERFINRHNCSFYVDRLPELVSEKLFDIILCMDVMSYFNDDERCVCYKNINDLLANDGVLLLQMPIQGDDIEKICSQIEHFFYVEKKEYVFGQLWYKMIEEKLFWVVESFYFNKTVFPLRIIGLFAYSIMKSRSLVEFVCGINRKFFPKLKSHIILTCRKRGC